MKSWKNQNEEIENYLKLFKDTIIQVLGLEILSCESTRKSTVLEIIKTKPQNIETIQRQQVNNK